jgi:hypothetical protein
MITGTSPNDTWVFGVDHPIPNNMDIGLPVSRHWNGISWSRGVPDDYAFAGGDDSLDGAGGLWVGGSTVFRMESLGWATIYTGYPGEQISLWGNGVGPVWVLGRDGSLMHGPSGN